METEKFVRKLGKAVPTVDPTRFKEEDLKAMPSRTVLKSIADQGGWVMEKFDNGLWFATGHQAPYDNKAMALKRWHVIYQP